MHVLVFAICISILILFLGYKQNKFLDAYCISAVVLIILLAAVFVFFVGRTDMFPLAALYIAFLLLMHHGVVHRVDDFSEEKCGCALFQCKDVSNHETWVVAAATAGVVSFFGF
jgi:hypothetical protein